MKHYQELKESFLTRYNALLLLNEDVAKMDFENMAEELKGSSQDSFLGYYNLSDLEEFKDEIVEAVDMEISKLHLDDPIEEGRLFANQLITL